MMEASENDDSRGVRIKAAAGSLKSYLRGVFFVVRGCSASLRPLGDSADRSTPGVARSDGSVELSCLDRGRTARVSISSDPGAARHDHTRARATLHVPVVSKPRPVQSRRFRTGRRRTSPRRGGESAGKAAIENGNSADRDPHRSSHRRPEARRPAPRASCRRDPRAPRRCGQEVGRAGEASWRGESKCLIRAAVALVRLVRRAVGGLLGIDVEAVVGDEVDEVVVDAGVEHDVELL